MKVGSSESGSLPDRAVIFAIVRAKSFSLVAITNLPPAIGFDGNLIRRDAVAQVVLFKT
ncbi:MAG: hypothetical protein ABI999_05735 [Acidobacteriota bacterium]